MKYIKKVITLIEVEVDLLAIPVSQWDKDISDHITPKMIRLAKDDLFPKRKLIELVKHSIDTMLDLSDLV